MYRKREELTESIHDPIINRSVSSRGYSLIINIPINYSVSGRKIAGYIMIGLGVLLILLGAYIGFGVFMEIYQGNVEAYGLVFLPFLYLIIPGIVLLLIGAMLTRTKKP